MNPIPMLVILFGIFTLPWGVAPLVPAISAKEKSKRTIGATRPESVKVVEPGEMD